MSRQYSQGNVRRQPVAPGVLNGRSPRPVSRAAECLPGPLHTTERTFCSIDARVRAGKQRDGRGVGHLGAELDADDGSGGGGDGGPWQASWVGTRVAGRLERVWIGVAMGIVGRLRDGEPERGWRPRKHDQILSCLDPPYKAAPHATIAIPPLPSSFPFPPSAQVCLSPWTSIRY